MKKKYSLKTAIREARRIRSNMLRMKQWRGTELTGACGLASILLSIAVDDVNILRAKEGHVWTQVGRTIIDITATQFNGEYSGTTGRKMPEVRGVLVTQDPLDYHTPVRTSGLRTFLDIINDSWYDRSDHARWEQISEYWL